MKQEFTFELLIEKLKKGEDFSWSRFGDGEWAAILQNRKEGAMNCDGHHYFPDLGTSLTRIVDSQPNYFIGLQNLAREQNKDDWDFQRLVEKNEWCDNEMLHRASIKGYLNEFFDAVNENSPYIVLVGNDSLRQLTQIKYNAFISIPEKDCWTAYSDIVRQISRLLGNEPCTILYCASMMSNVLIDTFNTWPNITQIDCGSVFDPYVGKSTRSYHKKLKI